MRIRRISLLAVVGGCLAMSVSLGACSSDNKSSASGDAGPGANDGGPGSDAGPSSGKIRLGASLALSAPDLSGSAAGIRDAMKTAEAMINEAGGIRGKTLEIDIRDDKFEEATLKANITTMLETDKFPLIFGPQGSGQTKSVYAMVKAKQVVLISPSASSPDLSGNAQNPDFVGKDRYFFRTTVSDAFQGKVLGRLAYEGNGTGGGDGGAAHGCRKMGIIAIDNAYGTALADVTKASFEKLGGTVLSPIQKLPESFATDADADTKALNIANAFNANGAECQVLITYEAMGCRYLKTWSQRASGAPAGFVTLCGETMKSSGVLTKCRSTAASETSANYLANVVGTAPDPSPSTAAYSEFYQKFHTKFPAVTELAAYTPNGFDMVAVVGLALQAAGDSARGPVLRDAVRAVSAGGAKYTPGTFAQAMAAAQKGDDIDFDGASGPVDFDDNGDVVGGYTVWTVDQASGGSPAFREIRKIAASEIQ